MPGDDDSGLPELGPAEHEDATKMWQQYPGWLLADRNRQEPSLTPELKEYLGKLGPDARRSLTEFANTRTQIQQEGMLAALRMADSEFQAGVAPYMPEGSKIDPSVARFMTFPPEAGVSRLGGNIRGISTQGATEPYQLDFGEYNLQFEPGTVSAIEAPNATPRVWGHEYRHFEGSAGGAGGQQSELLNRVQDLMASQNKKELAENVRSLLELLMTSPSGAAADVLTDPNVHRTARYGTDEEIARLAREIVSEPIVSKTISGPGKGLPNAALGSYYKRIVLGDIEMPEDYREGGRTRLI